MVLGLASRLSRVIRPRGVATPSRALNLLGDRDVEWSWIAAHMPHGPGEALDFGNGGSHLGLLAARRGFTVTAVDLLPVHWFYRHPSLAFMRGDVLTLPLRRGQFDLVINCSTVEHVGLVGRYDVANHLPDGDVDAMTRLHELLKASGMMLLTIPVGQDAVFPPYCRVYGAQRLPKLLSGYRVEQEDFWRKDATNCWIPCDRESALAVAAAVDAPDPLACIYGLGCFVLRAQ